jgi:hypothetical protein
VGDAFDSFVELSLCDAIMSPPSTFAAMAAFVGRKPLWPLLERGQVLAPEQVILDALSDAARHPVFSCAVN